MKDFLRSYIATSRPQLSTVPTIDSINTVAKWFFAGFTRIAKQMLSGNVGSVLRLKYYEECKHYLMLVHETWSSLLLDARFDSLDYATILNIQARAPGNCTHDREHLEAHLSAGTVFPAYNHDVQLGIKSRLMQFTSRILSLSTFFEDFKYLETIAMCIRQLVPPKRGQTQKGALDEAKMADSMLFENAYQRVHLYTMRYVELLRPGSIRLERKEVRKVARLRNTQRWYHLASHIKQQGFEFIASYFSITHIFHEAS